MSCAFVLHTDGEVVVELVVRGPHCEETLALLAEPCRELVADLVGGPPAESHAASAAAARELEGDTWEVLSAVPPLEEPTSSTTPDRHRRHIVPPPPGSSNVAPIIRARAAGLAAAEKVAGRIQAVPASPPHPDGSKNRYYVVLASYAEHEPQRGVYVRWNQGWIGEAGARAAVSVPSSGALTPEAVFHGFPTMREVDANCAAAGVVRPPTRS